MAQTIQFRRGNEANLPSLAPGEPAITLDTTKVFVGSPNGNIEVAKKTKGTVNIMDFGAKCDGVTDDTAAVRSAISYAETTNATLFIPGVSVITGELEFKKGIVVQGIGTGSGYGGNTLVDYAQKSGFLVKGTGTKRVRTRRLHRANASSPQDAPLSVALNVQAENVVFRDFTVFLDFDKTDITTPTNYGAAWDIGIFVGCRTHFAPSNVHVLGYFREASFYYDVTHAGNLPRFNDLNGVPYDNTQNVSGGDGCTMYKCFALGGKWGVLVGGAIPADGFTHTSVGAPQYYDEATGLVDDNRGAFGFSDFTTYSCSFYGTDHHTSYRRNAANGAYLTDTAGGSMYVSGVVTSGKIQGHRHFSTRFASFEPYGVKLDYANRVIFTGCHMESRNLTSRKNPDGSNVLDTQKYGLISCTDKTDNVILTGHTGALDYTFIPSNVGMHLYAPASSTVTSKITDKFIANGLETSNGVITSSTGELDLRSATDNDPVRLRRGNTTAFLATITSTTLYNDVASNSDNLSDLGSASKRWKTIYAGTGTISTSDRNAKTEIGGIPDEVLNAWAEVNYSRFKFKDAVAEKGDKARWHIGVIAQEIEETFYRHGLSALAFGLLCYDEWEESVDDEGNVIPAGSRYSIRPDECLMLEAALLRRKLERLEALL